jgi:hypothetical protein
MRLFRWCDHAIVEIRAGESDRRGSAEAIIIVDTRRVGDGPFRDARSKAGGLRNLHPNYTAKVDYIVLDLIELRHEQIQFDRGQGGSVHFFVPSPGADIGAPEIAADPYRRWYKLISSRCWTWLMLGPGLAKAQRSARRLRTLTGPAFKPVGLESKMLPDRLTCPSH